MIDRTIYLEVGETTYHLKPTLDAMKRVHRDHGSLVEALHRVRSLDFGAICAIIAAGAGHNQKQAEKMQQLVFEHGVVHVTGEVADFLAVLMDPTGGSDDEEEDEVEPEGNP